MHAHIRDKLDKGLWSFKFRESKNEKPTKKGQFLVNEEF
jgi:hypothetical protein